MNLARSLLPALTAAALLSPGAVSAATSGTTFAIDPGHSTAEFTVVHLAISHVKGTIPIKAGTIVEQADGQTPSDIEATLDVSGIDSKNTDRDRSLRSPEWFDAAKDPTIVFHSTKLAPGQGAGNFTAMGMLTMHGLTKPVTLLCHFEGKSVDGRGVTHVGYSATTTVDRRNWEMNFGRSTPGGSLVAGNDVTIDLEIEAAQEK